MAVLSGGGLEGENYSRKLGKKITRVLLLFSTQGWGRERGNVVIRRQIQTQRQTNTNTNANTNKNLQDFVPV